MRVEEIQIAVADVVPPPPDITVSGWADENRRLSSESAAERGEWHTDRAPYQRAIMDALSPGHPCEHVGGDERLIEAHRKAVAEMLNETEAIAATRVRMNGANEDRITGNVVMACFEHDSSRQLDPQLHTHCVAANLTFDPVEDRWKALQAGPFYEQRRMLTEVYRNALAREVQEPRPFRQP